MTPMEYARRQRRAQKRQDANPATQRPWTGSRMLSRARKAAKRQLRRLAAAQPGAAS